jgi:hypothetical protein
MQILRRLRLLRMTVRGEFFSNLFSRAATAAESMRLWPLRLSVRTAGYTIFENALKAPFRHKPSRHGFQSVG